MAKNLFEQFLGFAASKLAGPVAHDVYITETPADSAAPSGSSSVARYLAKLEAAERAKGVSTAVTGVEKYLARQAQAAAEAEAARVAAMPLTGVARYLAGSSPAPSAKKPVSEPEAKPAPVAPPKTGVEKYLVGDAESKKPVAAEKPKAAPEPKPAKEPAPKAAAPKATEELINLDDGAQCQSSTVKGTQCKNVTALESIKIKINGIHYQFTTCKQHNTEKFKPFAPLLG